MSTVQEDCGQSVRWGKEQNFMWHSYFHFKVFELLFTTQISYQIIRLKAWSTLWKFTQALPFKETTLYCWLERQNSQPQGMFHHHPTSMDDERNGRSSETRFRKHFNLKHKVVQSILNIKLRTEQNFSFWKECFITFHQWHQGESRSFIIFSNLVKHFSSNDC